ncbi:putative membrane protein [Erysiphe neolycopersici]|uniref:Putative membrane protein n=1 Tax=Erysiphe neolycopersici TaxID=212602 RepID=A0A420H7Z4_9PEZI|nr:putative membrane protein [Erysiphe neolycopersici]
MAGERGKSSSKLPVQQLLILVLCRVAEPVVFTSIYPYIPEMIESFGVPKDQVPKWAGITSSIFSISQAITAIFWGRASDRFGRKPAVITGLTCTMICSLIWGFSTNLAMAITARGIQGAFNGNVGIIRTMVAEMVQDKELQPRAFSIMPMIWSLGSIFGPSFGGFFAKPAEHMPRLFGHNAFFIRYPFALPNILASALFMVGITTAILFLKETHIVYQHKRDYGIMLGTKLKNLTHKCFSRPNPLNKSSHYIQDDLTETSRLLTSSTYPKYQAKILPINSSSKRKTTTLFELFTWQTSLNLLVNAFLFMHNVSYDQLLPILMHNSPTKSSKSLGFLPIKFSGGFGLESSRIGALFTIYGILSCFVQFLLFPPTARRFGVHKCLKACAITFPIIYFITPYSVLIESSLHQQIFITIIMAIKSIAIIFANPCSLILLTNSAKNLTILGTLNGLAVCLASVGRAIGPAICGPTFTWGIKNDYIIAPWWLLSVLAILGAVPIWWIVEEKAFKNSDADETRRISISDEIPQDRNSHEPILTIDEEAPILPDQKYVINRRENIRRNY